MTENEIIKFVALMGLSHIPKIHIKVVSIRISSNVLLYEFDETNKSVERAMIDQVMQIKLH